MEELPYRARFPESSTERVALDDVSEIVLANVCVCMCAQYTLVAQGAQTTAEIEKTYATWQSRSRKELRRKEKGLRKREGESRPRSSRQGVATSFGVPQDATPTPLFLLSLFFTLSSLGRHVHNASALITLYMHNKDKNLGEGNADACVVCQIALYTVLQMMRRRWWRAKSRRALHLFSRVPSHE